jgi:hypothetical protein
LSPDEDAACAQPLGSNDVSGSVKRAKTGSALEAEAEHGAADGAAVGGAGEQQQQQQGLDAVVSAVATVPEDITKEAVPSVGHNNSSVSSDVGTAAAVSNMAAAADADAAAAACTRQETSLPARLKFSQARCCFASKYGASHFC